MTHIREELKEYFDTKLEGCKAICDFLNWSSSKYNRRREELERAGVLSYVPRKDFHGGKKSPCTTKGKICKWTQEKGKKGEPL